MRKVTIDKEKQFIPEKSVPLLVKVATVLENLILVPPYLLFKLLVNNWESSNIESKNEGGNNFDPFGGDVTRG